MPEAAARLIPIGGSLDSVCVFSKVGADGSKPWTMAVQGELPAADDKCGRSEIASRIDEPNDADSVIQEKDGVFTISANVPTAHVVCDPGFKSLVDSIMKKNVD